MVCGLESLILYTSRFYLKNNYPFASKMDYLLHDLIPLLWNFPHLLCVIIVCTGYGADSKGWMAYSCTYCLLIIVYCNFLLTIQLMFLLITHDLQKLVVLSSKSSIMMKSWAPWGDNAHYSSWGSLSFIISLPLCIKETRKGVFIKHLVSLRTKVESILGCVGCMKDCLCCVTMNKPEDYFLLFSIKGLVIQF